MKVKVNEAVGPVLNWMVGCALDEYSPSAVPEYSTDWAQGGPIIEWEKIDLYQSTGRTCAAMWENLPGGGRLIAEAKDCPTPLIAGMRCYVSSRLGDTVEVPDELA
jgi:hypothetical protein